MIRATSADRTEIRAFLAAHVLQAMFPLANLANHGMAGGHPRAMRFWIRRAGGAVQAVLGVTEAGMVMPLLPQVEDRAAAAQALAELDLTGMVGPGADVSGLRRAAGLDGAPVELDEVEVQMALDLSHLRLPEGPGSLRALDAAPAAVIRDWMADYHLKTLHAPPDRAAERGAAGYAAALAAGNYRVLMDGDTPLALSGFNAALPQAVQLGGIYTPPDLRGRGHARRAVALHLAEARAAGVPRATLFTSSAPAARAYRAVGFTDIGDWSLVLFDGPQRVKGGVQ